MLLKAHSSGGRTAAFPSWNGCRCSILAAHDLEGALANLPRQDADCVGLMGVNVYGPAARLEFTRRAAEREEHDAMREIEIHDYARQLLEAHGAKAIAEAAQNAIDLEAKGEVELARTWRHIEDALKLMRGPHQS
jgi:hypothetical protein